MPEQIQTRRGVYKDLSRSPYVVNSPYGDCFRFPSEKKLEIYLRELEKDCVRVEKLLIRTGLVNLLPDHVIELIGKTLYRALYDRIVKR